MIREKSDNYLTIIRLTEIGTPDFQFKNQNAKVKCQNFKSSP